MAFVTVLHRGNRARCETLWTLLCAYGRSVIKWIGTHSGGILLEYLSNYTAEISISVLWFFCCCCHNPPNNDRESINSTDLIQTAFSGALRTR